jgi:hypothetical protein
MKYKEQITILCSKNYKLLGAIKVGSQIPCLIILEELILRASE